jgi:hypothetical protein
MPAETYDQYMTSTHDGPGQFLTGRAVQRLPQRDAAEPAPAADGADR